MAETGREMAHEVCAWRGHHGPFANLDKYNDVPGWGGLGDCLTCGTTCRTDGHLPAADGAAAEP